ncbi:MAG: ABC transporter permease subunit [Phycisphaera sp.]|nr:ABC transporter permease subunit [Phycisphaera sp.]
MKVTLSIARRELTSLFFSPIAYVVLGLFCLGTSLIFILFYYPGQPATLRNTLFWVVWLMIFLVPAISMRLMSEEFRAGTIEMLMTAPVSDAQVVIGKWLGAMGFYLALLLPIVAFIIVLACTSKPDFGPIMTGLIGLLLVGGFYLSIGLFASTVTQNQIIAFLLTVFVICLLTFATFFFRDNELLPTWARATMTYLNINAQFDDFAKGLIDTSKLIYFSSGTAFFLFLAGLSLQSRRWR